MKTRYHVGHFFKVLSRIAAIVVLLPVLSASAATLSGIGPTKIGNYNSTTLKISVFPGRAAYTSTDAGASSGDFGDGTVLDYRFFNGVGWTRYVTPINTNGYADGAGLRVRPVSSFYDESISSLNSAAVWTSNNPGAVLSDANNYNHTTATLLCGSGLIGSVDISGLSSGTLYVIGGHDRGSSPIPDLSVSVTMSGAGLTPTNLTKFSVDPGRAVYLWEFTFNNTEGYDTLSYNFGGASAGVRPTTPYPGDGVFMGLILDGSAPVGDINWSEPKVTAVSTSTADVEATIDGPLTEAVLVWDTTDHGNGGTNDWPADKQVRLGPQTAGVVTGQLINLQADTAYAWRLYGINSGANEAWTLEQGVVTKLSAAQAPVFTNATLNSLNLDVTLGWQDKAANETGYLLERSTNGTTFTFVTSTLDNTISYKDTVPLPGVYYYRLAATNYHNASVTDFALCETNVTVAAPPLYLESIVNLGTSYKVSLHEGKAAYSGNGNTGVLGDGTVLDYRLFKTLGSDSNGYANGAGGRIGPLTEWNPYSSDGDADGDVWTGTDPGSLTDGIPSFATTADFGVSTITTAQGGVFGGTIDISGLVSGHVYGIGGDDFTGGARPYTFTLIMKGSGPEVAVVATFSASKFLLGFPFINDGSYDTIDFATSGTSSTGLFMGMILDGEQVPIKGSMFLFQ